MDAMGSLDGSKISIFPGWAPTSVTLETTCDHSGCSGRLSFEAWRRINTHGRKRCRRERLCRKLSQGRGRQSSLRLHPLPLGLADLGLVLHRANLVAAAACHRQRSKTISAAASSADWQEAKLRCTPGRT